MKRIILAGLFLNLTFTAVFSQSIQKNDDPDNLFYLATDQFRQKEFPGCYRTIGTWFEESKNPTLLEEAGFLRAAAAYELDKRETSILLIQYLEKYPASPHAAKAYFLLGCCALNAGQFKDAIDFFNLCPEEDLTPKELFDFQFRFAYASFQAGDYETSRKIFGPLMTGENRYVGSATYFSAYMDYAEGKRKEAMIGFNKIAEHAQYKQAVPYFNLQLLYLDGKLDEMLSKAEVLMTQSPNILQKTELTRLMAAAWFDKKDFRQSHSYYLEYIAQNPKILQSDIYRMGINYYIRKDYATAINYLSRVTGSKSALSQSATFHLGLCYLKQGKNDIARMSFEQASLQDYDKVTKEKALYNYALLCYETSFSPFNEQVTAFQRILSEFPNSQFADNIYGYLAEVFLTSKEYEHSLSEIQKIANPDNKLLQTKCQLQFLLGVERFNNNLFNEAISLFSSSIDLAKSLSLPTAETYFWRGEANYKLNQLSAATQDYKRFIESPGASKLNAFPIASYNLGYTYFNSKNYTDALTWFNKYIAQTGVKKEKSYTDALNRIGDCYFQARDYVKAEKQYQNADLSTPSGNDYATYQKGFSLGLRKQYKAKIDLLNHFETRFPQSDYTDDAIFETGRTYILMDKPDQAIETFNHLMKDYKESLLSPKAGIQIALQYYNQGKKDEAITAYKKVIENYPGSQEAQMALSDLKMIHVNNNTVNEYISYTKGLSNQINIETGEPDSLSYMAAEHLLMADKKTEAIKSFKSYLSDYPAGAFTTDSHYHLGRLLLAENQKEEALEHLDVVSKQDGNKFQAEAAQLAAESYYTDKNYEKALACFEKMETLASLRNTRITAKTGILRCRYFLKQSKDIVAAANELTSEPDLSKDILREARYYRAMTLLEDKQKDKAKVDLELLSVEAQTAFGAESRYRLADYYFNQGSSKEAEKIIQNFIKEGTSQSYWLARSFILLSDIHIQGKDDFQAKQYLLSLKENYKAEDDIQEMISTRLSAIVKRNN